MYFSELDGLQMYMGRGQQKLKNWFSGFLTRTVYCSELDRKNIRLGSENRKSLSSSLLTRTVYFSERERDTYTVRVKKQEKCVSGFLTRTVYFSERGRDTYTVRVKKQEQCVSGFLTRAVYFSELELAEIYGAGQKTGKQNLQDNSSFVTYDFLPKQSRPAEH